MTLSIKIAHNSPGYPVRALVSVRGADGAEVFHGKTRVGDGESPSFYVHANQWLKVTEVGHQDVDLTPIAKRAYEAFARSAPAHATLAWEHLDPRTQDGWRAAAEALV